MNWCEVVRPNDWPRIGRLATSVKEVLKSLVFSARGTDFGFVIRPRERAGIFAGSFIAGNPVVLTTWTDVGDVHEFAFHSQYEL